MRRVAICKNKRAQFSMVINEGVMVMRMLLMIFVALSVVILVKRFVILTIDARPLEANILMNRFIFSPECLSYEDNLQRTEPGIISLSRFRNDTLDSCMYYGSQNDFMAANLSLLFLDTKTRQEALYNTNGYLLLKPRAGLEGPGGSLEFTTWRYLLVEDKGILRKAILYMDIMVPNG
jgi:hypothetical protein